MISVLRHYCRSVKNWRDEQVLRRSERVVAKKRNHATISRPRKTRTLSSVKGSRSAPNALLILAVYRMIPQHLIHLHPHEPPQQQALLPSVDQHSFAAYRIEDLQKQGTKQPFGSTASQTADDVSFRIDPPPCGSGTDELNIPSCWLSSPRIRSPP
jgi:hypothetical protein